MSVLVSNYKKSIYEIGLPRETEAMIWDFYVTRSFASSASQKRKVGDFDIKSIPLDKMLKQAGFTESNFRFMPCTTMTNTIKSLNLCLEEKNKNNKIIEIELEDIETPRMCCLQPFMVTEDKKIEPRSSKADCLFTHIRNAMAHGNTFFFDNGNVLLEDKDKGKITAMILISVQALVEWIRIIDSKGIVYPLEK